jgi:hypothetical protein
MPITPDWQNLEIPRSTPQRDAHGAPFPSASISPRGFTDRKSRPDRKIAPME